MQFGKMYLAFRAALCIIMNIGLRYVALQLCTCTWIEIMTGAGITLYLTYLQNYMLAVLTLAVFSPLIAFHFAMTRLSKSEDYCASAACIRRSRFSNTSKKSDICTYDRYTDGNTSNRHINTTILLSMIVSMID